MSGSTGTHKQAVLVTGAGGGIGAALVRRLAERQFAVFAAVHKDDGALAGIPGVTVVPLDVTDPGAVGPAADEVAAHPAAAGGLRAVVNNAGVIVQGPLELVPPAELQRQFAVNTLGPAYVTQALLPLLRAGGGRVVNVSATTARVAMPLFGALSGSKAALVSFSDALRVELAAWRIPVVVVEPGATDTRIFTKAADAAGRATAAADPRRVALYENHLAALAKAVARQRNRPLEPVVRTLVKAVETARPKRHYAVGDARAAGLLSRLPAPVRGRVIARALGLNGVAPGTAR
jgi:NAD(P)-dependent dehydrogenase (short-subunit alcohol dehydrogenase family)